MKLKRLESTQVSFESLNKTFTKINPDQVNICMTSLFFPFSFLLLIVRAEIRIIHQLCYKHSFRTFGVDKWKLTTGGQSHPFDCKPQEKTLPGGGNTCIEGRASWWYFLSAGIFATSSEHLISSCETVERHIKLNDWGKEEWGVLRALTNICFSDRILPSTNRGSARAEGVRVETEGGRELLQH